MKYILNHDIRKLAISFIWHKDIVCSWGIHDILLSQSSISFIAEGFKVQGQVEIKLSDDASCCIYIGKRYVCNCCVDDVVRLLDSKIEKTKSYKHDIINWLKG